MDGGAGVPETKQGPALIDQRKGLAVAFDVFGWITPRWEADLDRREARQAAEP